MRIFCNYFSPNLRCVHNNKAHIKFGSGAISFRWSESKHRYQILPQLLLVLLLLRISELHEIWSYIERGSKYRARDDNDELSFRNRIQIPNSGKGNMFILLLPWRIKNWNYALGVINPIDTTVVITGTSIFVNSQLKTALQQNQRSCRILISQSTKLCHDS